MNARSIVREARREGIDPAEHARDLADGYGWDEDMADDAVAAVRALVERETCEHCGCSTAPPRTVWCDACRPRYSD